MARDYARNSVSELVAAFKSGDLMHCFVHQVVRV
jgi:hypothetical protein